MRFGQGLIQSLINPSYGQGLFTAGAGMGQIAAGVPQQMREAQERQQQEQRNMAVLESGAADATARATQARQQQKGMLLNELISAPEPLARSIEATALQNGVSSTEIARAATIRKQRREEAEQGQLEAQEKQIADESLVILENTPWYKIARAQYEAGNFAAVNKLRTQLDAEAVEQAQQVGKRKEELSSAFQALGLEVPPERTQMFAQSDMTTPQVIEALGKSSLAPAGLESMTQMALNQGADPDVVASIRESGTPLTTQYNKLYALNKELVDAKKKANQESLNTQTSGWKNITSKQEDELASEVKALEDVMLSGWSSYENIFGWDRDERVGETKALFKNAAATLADRAGVPVNQAAQELLSVIQQSDNMNSMDELEGLITTMVNGYQQPAQETQDVVTVNSREEVEALASGTRFKGPDGVVRVKP